MSSKILLRRGTAAQWSSANPILGIGELGIETDTLKIKIGNGTSTWTQLTSYANVTPSQLTSEINNLINAAPSTLDTLNELAAAINNDASFSTTVNNLLTGKVSKSGGDTITSSTASTIGLIIKGAASQTANLQEWQNSSGTTISWVNSTGGISLPRTALIRFNGGVGSDRAYITSNTNNDLIFASAGGTEHFRLYGGAMPFGALLTTGTASAVGLTIKSVASQTADLQQWQTSTGALLVTIGATGNTWIRGGARVSGNYGGSQALFIQNDQNIIGLTIKANTTQTANLQEWQNSAGTLVAGMDASGKLIVPTLRGPSGSVITLGVDGSPYALSISSTQFDSYGPLPWRPYATNMIGFIIKGLGSQTANLQEWQNSDGVAVAEISATGSITTRPVGFSGNLSTPIISVTDRASTWTAGNFAFRSDSNGIPRFSFTAPNASSEALTINGNSVGVQTPSPGAVFQVTSNGASNIVSIIKGAASQSADLQQWQNSSGTVLSKVDSSGNITAPNYILSNSLYTLRKNIKKTIDPAGSALANNTYDLFQIAFASSLQGVFSIQASIRGSGYGQSMSYTLPATYRMDWLSQYGVTNPFVDGANFPWVDLTPITFSPRHLMTSDAFKLQARVDNNTIFFRIKLTGTLTNTPLFDVYIQHSEEFANSTITELSSTGTDSTTSSVMPNFLSSKFGTSTIFNPLTISSSFSSSLPLLIKAASGQTASLVEWQNSSGNVLSFIGTLGQFGTSSTVRGSSGGTFGGNTQLSSAGLTVYSTAAGNPGAIIRASASQTANIMEWQDSGGVVQANISSIGRIYSAQRFAINDNRVFEGMGNIFTNATTTLGFIIQGVASQTADLQQWRNSAGSVLGKVTSDGTFTLGSMYITSGTHKAYGPLEILNNASGNSKLDIIGFGGLALAGLTLGVKNTDNANNRNWQLNVGGGGYAGQSGNFIGEGGLLFVENNPNDSSSADRGGFRRGGQFALGGVNTYSASLSITPLSTSTLGQVIRANASQTADLQQWQDSTGAVLAEIMSNGSLFVNSTGTSNDPITIQRASATRFKVDPYGNVFVGALTAGNVVTSIAGTTAGIYTTSASNIGLIIRGVTSQTANLQEWQNSSGTVLSRIREDGMGFFPKIFGTRLFAGSEPGDWSTYSLYSYSTAANIITLGIQGNASQTADLTQWKNSTGTVLVSVSPLGFINTLSGIGTNTTSYMNGIADSSATKMSLSFNSTSYGLLLTNIQPAAVGYIVRGAASQTANLQEWQNSAGTVVSSISASGASIWGGGYNIFGGDVRIGTSSYFDSELSLSPRVVSEKGLVVRGLASQTANLQEWQDNNGTVLTSVTPNGRLWIKSTTENYATLQVNAYANGASAANFTGIGGGAEVVFIRPGDTTQLGLVIRGVASQTGDLQQWQNNSGTALAKVDANGSATFTGSASTNAISAYAGASGTYVFQGFNQSNNLTSIIYQSGEIYSASNIYVRGAANYSAAINVKPGSTSTLGIVVRGLTSQSADLQQWQDNSGTSVLKIGADGSVRGNGTFGAWGGAYSQFDTNGNPTFKYLMGYNVTAGGYYTEPSEVKLTVRAANLQTADLQQWQNSSGAVLAEITASGSLELNGKDIELMNIMGAY